MLSSVSRPSLSKMENSKEMDNNKFSNNKYNNKFKRKHWQVQKFRNSNKFRSSKTATKLEVPKLQQIQNYKNKYDNNNNKNFQ